MAGAQLAHVREAVRVRRVVGVAQQVAGVELGLVFQDGGFELAELRKDQVALLAALELDAVDCGLRFDGWVVG